MTQLRGALTAVQRIAFAGQGDSSVAEVLEQICRAVAEELAFERVLLVRCDAEADEVSLVGLVGGSRDRVPERLRLRELPLFARACAERSLVSTADARGEGALPARLADAYGVTSLFALPLVTGDRCLGVLAGDRRGRLFELEPEDERALTAVGVVAATLLEKAVAGEELRRLDSLKSEFVALASHELRNPVGSVYGVAVTLEQRGDELAAGQLRELRRSLVEQTTRLRSLVEQLLDVSRFDSSAIEVRPRRLCVRGAVEELVGFVAGGRRGSVALEIDPALEASVDPVALDRIVSNLVANALRYGEPPITVTATPERGRLRLAVEDSGRGVSSEFAPRLFDRFTRSRDSHEDGGGSGLGLAIAREYARAHGGDLVYEPGVPRGSRFVAVLVPEPRAA